MNKFKQLFYLCTFFLFLFVESSHLFAADEKSTLTKQDILDESGHKISISILSYKNHNDDFEVRLESRGLPRIMNKINPLLGFGRDINNNGIIDTWFLTTKNGIEIVKKEGIDPLGKDVLGRVLNEKYKSTLGMYVQSAASSLLSVLFLSVNEGVNIQEEYYRDYIDLEQMRLQFEENLENPKTAITRNQIQFHYQLLSFGFKDLADKMEHFSKRSFWGYTLADIGLWVTGGIVVSWAARVLAKIGIIASETAFITAIKDSVVSFFEKQKIMVHEKIQIAKGRLTQATVKKESAIVLSAAIYKYSLTQTLKSYKIKNKLHSLVVGTIKFPKNIIKGASSEWRYIGMNTSVQLASEAYTRYDEIKGENPAETMRNLLTHSDVQQNVGFMTADTIMMIGVSKNLKTTKARYMASGAVALTNSTIVNFGFKEDADLSRVAFDTSWEAIIGNGQVQLDLMALEYFEKLSQKKNNPKIKLLGYAVALIDMAAGYVVYSKVTTALEKKKNEEVKPQVILVPVFAEKD
jgi:regulator of PEP synthase PpsR (kinase-PPPase family)